MRKRPGRYLFGQTTEISDVPAGDCLESFDADDLCSKDLCGIDLVVGQASQINPENRLDLTIMEGTGCRRCQVEGRGRGPCRFLTEHDVTVLVVVSPHIIWGEARSSRKRCCSLTNLSFGNLHFSKLPP